MDPNTSIISEASNDVSQVLQAPQESPDTDCPICFEPLSARRTATCICCLKDFHWTCFRESLVNDLTLKMLPGGRHGHYWDFHQARCPMCRTPQKDTEHATSLMQNLDNISEILENTRSQFYDHVSAAVRTKGRDIAKELFHAGSTNDIPSRSTYLSILNELRNQQLEHFSEFVHSRVKCMLRGHIIINFVTDERPKMSVLFKSNKIEEHQIRIMIFKTKEEMYSLSFGHKLKEFYQKIVQYIIYKVKKFALENILEGQFPLMTKEFFKETTRAAHIHYKAYHLKFHSEWRNATTDDLNSFEKEQLERQHIDGNDEIDLSPFKVMVAKFHALNQVKFELRGADAWTSWASKIITEAPQHLPEFPPDDPWFIPAHLPELSPDDPSVVPAVEPPPKRMRTHSQGPQEP